jgi:hypothetical protein
MLLAGQYQYSLQPDTFCRSWLYSWDLLQQRCQLSLLGVFVFLIGAGAGQSLAGFVVSRVQGSELMSALLGTVAQYAVYVFLFLVLDHNSLTRSLSGALYLLVFVRIFYFIKNLKKDG